MKVLLFGATGMVGQGVLRECLLDPGVERVVAVRRRSTGQSHPKLHEIVLDNLMNSSPVEKEVGGYDACFFCLGVSAAGMTEPDYRRQTYDLTLALARPLARDNPGMTFVYVSGTGTDGTGRSRWMWARVKGETENALLALPFRAAYMFRPGFIQPLHGVRSRTGWYRALYAVLAPLYPALKLLFPGQLTTTEQVGRAMLAVVRRGWSTRWLENRDINALAASGG